MGIALTSINPSLLEIIAATHPDETVILTSDPLYALRPRQPMRIIYEAQWCDDAPRKPMRQECGEVIDAEDLSGQRYLPLAEYLRAA